MTLDRSVPPTRGEASTTPFPRFERHTLRNGLTLLVARRPAVPLLSLEFVGTATSSFDEDRPGRASLTAALLDEGTQTRTSTEIADQIERRGGSIGAGCDWDSSYLSLGILAKDLDFGVELLSDCVLSAAFSPEETERLRSRYLAEIARRADQPDALANERFAAALYEPGPYSHPQIGDRATLEDLAPAELRGFAEAHRLTDRSFVLAVGDVDPDELERRLEAALGDRPVIPTPGAPAPRARQVTERQIHIVDRPDAQQTVLRIGHVGVPREHDARTALVLLNSLFGGKFTSRVNLNLRERHGFTYGVSSSFQFRKHAGPFVVGTSVANEVAGPAVEQLLIEMQRLVDEAPSQEEVDDARAYLLGVFPYGLQTLNGLASRIEEIQIHDLPDDYYDTMAERLALTPQDLLDAARRVVQPDRSVLVAVGPKRLLAPELERFGTLVEV